MTDSPVIRQALAYLETMWPNLVTPHTFAVTNPATGAHLADLPNMGAAQTTTAIDRATEALAHDWPLSQRRQWLEQAHDKLLKSKDELAHLITLEQGKPLRESIGEIEYAAAFFQFTCDHCHVLADEHLPNQVRGCQWRLRHRPAGVAALITPWNFPVAMVAKKLSAALAAGCPVIIKPAEQTPLSTLAMLNSFQGMDLPRGMINFVAGDPAAIGKTLCTHPSVRVISFTGSTDVGKLLLAQTAEHVKRLSLELGGNAPFMVFDDADIQAAVDALIANKFRASGQTCVCANRVYIHANVHDAFVKRLVENVQAMKAGNGLDPDVDIGPLISRDAFDKVAAHVADALDKGARHVVGQIPDRPAHHWGAYYPPTVLTDIQPHMRLCQEETFGPVIAIARFHHEEELIQQANATVYGLAAYLFTSDPTKAQRMINHLNFGHIGINTGTGPAPHAPFGGMKQSGFGREGGAEGMLEFCATQVVAAYPANSKQDDGGAQS